ncbi:ribosome biogenesis GTP-binding protein YihA/YsxC [soil metagenome]
MAPPPLRLRFVTSAARLSQLPARRAEVAFVGRSNVGKSSLINALAGTRQLARVSNTPGRTQLINLFDLLDREHAEGADAAVVDLPGYGYAKVPGRIRREWPEMIEGYLLDRESLVQVFVLVDGPIGPTPLDVQMLDWLRENQVPHTVVATKQDKVKSSKRDGRRTELASGCRLERGDIVWTSTSSGDGIDLLRSLVRGHLA